MVACYAGSSQTSYAARLTQRAHTSTNYPARTGCHLLMCMENSMPIAQLWAGYENHSEAVDPVPSEMRERPCVINWLYQQKELSPVGQGSTHSKSQLCRRQRQEDYSSNPVKAELAGELIWKKQTNKKTKKQKDWSMAEVIECSSNKHKVPCPIPSTTKQRNLK
jgi:hypothetical protein